MVRAIVVPADPDEPLRELDTSVPDAVGTAVGGFMEAVDLFDLGITIYVNESGLLQHLSFNSRTSFLWWHYALGGRRRSTLVGDAVIVGLPDEDGADTEVPSATWELLHTDAAYLVDRGMLADFEEGDWPRARRDWLRSRLSGTLLTHLDETVRSVV